MFQKPFSFNGRIGRREYGFTAIIYVAVEVLMSYISDTPGAVAIELILLIPSVWLLWSQGAKRCHDLDVSGWYQLIPLYFLVLLFTAGTPGKNKYDVAPRISTDDAPLDYTEIQSTPVAQPSNSSSASANIENEEEDD